jgi:hypothetical protein
MKTNEPTGTSAIGIGLLAMSLFAGCEANAGNSSGQTNSALQRIGIYDSRVVAFGNFWSEAHQRNISERMKAAKEAKTAGETNRFVELKTGLKAEQEKVHLQVFSSAPVDDVLSGMKDRVQAIQQEAGVSQLVSKWDKKTLAEHKDAEKVDVTDLFLREFKLNERQMKIVADMRKKPPVPLEEVEELMRKGKL